MKQCRRAEIVVQLHTFDREKDEGQMFEKIAGFAKGDEREQWL